MVWFKIGCEYLKKCALQSKRDQNYVFLCVDFRSYFKASKLLLNETFLVYLYRYEYKFIIQIVCGA